MAPPSRPKIYHLLHVDKLSSVIAEGCIWSDAQVRTRQLVGTAVGLTNIKDRRLHANRLNSYPDLHVGECVPFYFCARSVMLYMLARGNHAELTYKGGQDPILLLEADFHQAVAWADQNDRRWVFTTTNAGTRFFEDFANLGELGRIDWQAVQARDFRDRYVKERKQAEFLMERAFPWLLVERIGVRHVDTLTKVNHILTQTNHRPPVERRGEWYF